MLTLNDGRERLYQWDKGRTATVNVDCDTVHFSNLSYGEAVVVEVEVKDGVVEIPNTLLRNGADIICYAFVEEKDGSYTRQELKIEVVRRPKPADYIYEETDTYTIQAAVLNALGDIFESGELEKRFLDKIYPVGSHVISEDSDFDPNKSWVGRWTLTSQNRMLIGAGDRFPVGSTGGSETATLTVENLAPHSHQVLDSLTGRFLGYHMGGEGSFGFTHTSQGRADDWITTTVGSGLPFSVLNPFKAVYIWHRVG